MKLNAKSTISALLFCSFFKSGLSDFGLSVFVFVFGIEFLKALVIN